ncbi:hypothetical protein CANCADRAFT_130564 [Tortispora caseinolytica NRRL Y-17796]|uniref:DNA replication licensing factor MCM5 n=1 Tax=Tortispora caseinolytica NRRL Y-17796 TaxID=767744 RepID=A0A1E4TAW6_9ASCO|nr:hypothetical protein CANCADRAFT_130564 [Tortispora caseinolytica NRRL Y-17796]
MSFDQGRLYTAHALPVDEPQSEASAIQDQFKDFLLEFRIGADFIYRQQIRENVLIQQYLVNVDMSHVVSYNEELADRLTNSPTDTLKLLEGAAHEVANRIFNIDPIQDSEGGETNLPASLPKFQILLTSNANVIPIPQLNADHVSKLVRVSGIVIGASTLSSQATKLQIMCRTCRYVRHIDVDPGMSTVALPKFCDAPPLEGQRKECVPNPFLIIHEKSAFIDKQHLKLQEAPDDVPVGEIPRHISMSCDRYLVNRVVPGTRCTVIGIYSIQSAKSKGMGNAPIRNPYLRVIGMQLDVHHTMSGNVAFSPEDEEEFVAMARQPNFYDIFAGSIAPSIYGNKDIKKAVACLLVGGTRRILPDGMRLRGDINILLLGDPGTAKSQMLKFVEKVAPISVYTSGKGSSAAGLTASVQRDAVTRDFYLEGGAMVLADGGVVCIDEFDKMREDDRVAIHEAMEQQTISIAKAGITTILNSRTSVLAAANPVFGRYDDLKSTGDNLDFQTTILSRFDMIFLVKDDHNTARDQSLARHVMDIHMNRQADASAVGDIDMAKMKRYISYCRSRCAPRLSSEAASKLSSYFVEIRKKVHESEKVANERSAIPITIRQLEAIVRISEALAKLTLQTVVAEEHVDEAVRLFNASTMNALQEGEASGQVFVQKMRQLSESLLDRLKPGFFTTYRTLLQEFCDSSKPDSYAKEVLDRVLSSLAIQNRIQYRNQRREIVRIG